ncbi:MAG: amino acid adenylation domain-containing protein, partial [Ardenticatenaceae bacterium]
MEQSIPSRFAEQVRKYTHNIALKTKRYEWTYQQLNERANHIAQAIVDLISEAGRIALLFEHDAPMIAGMLGALAAGKTYVPLDPLYPRERLLYILEDSQAQAIVTNNQNLAYARQLSKGTLQVINLDSASPISGRPKANNIEGLGGVERRVAREADQLAYILYTSGSTGQPKGVMQTHRNVLHFMRTYTNNLHISAQDKLTLLSSYSFDAAIMDIFGALLNGATLYPFDLKQNSLQELVEYLIEEEITIYHSTPTVYRHVINTLTGDEPFRNLRLIVMGGEAVYKPDVESYKKHFSDECLFVNGLGPTESTVTLQYFINKETELTRHAVPVGYPVDKTEILLLDKAGQESNTQGAGSIYGEIAIRSEHVALGYWRKEEKSAAVFLDDWPSPLTPRLRSPLGVPILGEGNPERRRKRLYRMGDLGRYLPDGSLEFVGRKDTQVKIRGYRIELGEVESALSQHPAVSENAVILWADAAADNKQLVAYVVCSEAVSSVELRDFMRQKLPSYMVPQTFIQLEALPQTSTRKIDRRALSLRHASRQCEAAPDLSGGQKESVAPRTPTEALLAGIWRQVLPIPSAHSEAAVDEEAGSQRLIGIHDNFFELGGHSLLAVQVISRIQAAFSVKLTLRDLFESPTIAELAKILDAQTQSQRQADPIMPIPRHPDVSVQPLSFAQRRLWDWQQVAGESA